MPGHADLGFGEHRRIQARGTHHLGRQALAEEGSHFVAERSQTGIVVLHRRRPVATGKRALNAQRRMPALMGLGAAEHGLERDLATQESADRQFLCDAHAAVQLDRLFGDAARSGRHLGPRGRGSQCASVRVTVALGGVHQCDRTQRHRPGLLAQHRHVRHPMTQHLVGGERLAELLARARVLDGRFQHRLHRADRLGAGHHQRVVTDAFELGRAGAGEQRIVADGHAVQLERAGTGAVDGVEGARGGTRGVARHDEEAQRGGVPPARGR